MCLVAERRPSPIKSAKFSHVQMTDKHLCLFRVQASVPGNESLYCCSYIGLLFCCLDSIFSTCPYTTGASFPLVAPVAQVQNSRERNTDFENLVLLSAVVLLKLDFKVTPVQGSFGSCSKK